MDTVVEVLAKKAARLRRSTIFIKSGGGAIYVGRDGRLWGKKSVRSSFLSRTRCYLLLGERKFLGLHLEMVLFLR